MRKPARVEQFRSALEYDYEVPYGIIDMLDEVLIAERRATVERVRSGFAQVVEPCHECSNADHVWAILDVEES